MSDSLDTHADAHTVLVRAKEYLLLHGWMQDSYGWDPDGPRCIMGALREVVGHSATSGDPYPRSGPAKEALGVFCRTIGSGASPAAWNDDESRTFDEVIHALDQAILATAPSAETREAIPA